MRISVVFITIIIIIITIGSIHPVIISNHAE